MSRPRLTAELVAGVAREIDACRDARVHAVHEDAPGRFRLALRGAGGRVDLVVDLDPDFPRAHLAPAAPAPASPTALAGALRALLAGGRLLAARPVPGDRALSLRLRARGEERTLWIELFGRQANVYVVEADGTVALTPRGDVARRRGAARGEAFEPPAAREEDPAPPVEDASAQVRRLAESATEAADLLAVRTPAARQLRRLRRAALAQAEALRAQAGRGGEADEHRRRGELLRGAFHLLGKGASVVRVPDYASDPPREVEVPVDPTLPAGEQVAACFAAERKCRRAMDEARRRLPELEARVPLLEDVLALVEAAPDADAVRAAVAGLPDALRKRVLPAAPGRRAAGPVRRRPWTTFVSRDGWRVLVGRDARGNDELTLHEAKPWDLFLHVRAASGSHVIVPTPRGKTVPKETLLDAAELACLFSERREAERNEVDYVERRHVRKARGAPPGQVLVERARTLSLRLDPQRRARLRASKDAPAGPGAAS